MDIVEKMQSSEGREQIREEIDFMEVLNLSKKIEMLAIEASNLAKKLASDEISESERSELESKLAEAVKTGSEADQQRARIFSRYQE